MAGSCENIEAQIPDYEHEQTVLSYDFDCQPLNIALNVSNGKTLHAELSNSQEITSMLPNMTILILFKTQAFKTQIPPNRSNSPNQLLNLNMIIN